jgi:hypothetical protein
MRFINGKEQAVDQDVHGNILSKCIFDRYSVKFGTGLNGLWHGSVAWFCEHGNNLSGCLKTCNFLTSQVIINFSRNILQNGVGWLVGWSVCIVSLDEHIRRLNP